MTADTATDALTRFLLPAAGVRGVAVRLDETWRTVAGRSDYPPSARELLGEASAAAVLFTGHSKVDGRLSIQLRSRGCLRSLFAECTAAGTVRGIAQVASDQDAPRDLRELGDDALLAITIENPGLDPREPQRYQSLVGLQASRLAEAFEDYFRQSEQLPTRLLLSADGDRACGLMLQKLPGDEGDDDGWNRAGRPVRHPGRGGAARHPRPGPAAPAVPRGIAANPDPAPTSLRLLLFARAGGEHAAAVGGGGSDRRIGRRGGRSPLRVLVGQEDPVFGRFSIAELFSQPKVDANAPSRPQ